MGGRKGYTPELVIKKKGQAVSNRQRPSNDINFGANETTFNWGWATIL